MTNLRIPVNKAVSRKWFGLAALTLPTLLLSIDTSVLYLALPQLSHNLKANSTQQLWIVDIYGFMVAGFLNIMGNLGDRIGYRKLLLMGSTAFGLASLTAAFSPNANLLIAARGLMGIAGATLMPSTLAIIRNLFTDQKQRGKAISIWMSCFMAGMIVGPFVGGVILEHYWWGAVFLLGVPVMLVAVPLGRILLPEFKHSTPASIHFSGVIYLLLAILPFIYGLTELAGNNVQPVCYLSVLAGVLFGTIFVRREKKALYPLCDFSLFRSRTICAVLLAMTITAVIMGGIALFITQYLQLIAGLTPFHAGLWMMPQAFGMIIGSLLIPIIVKYISSWAIISGGFILSTIGMLLLTNVTAESGLPLLVIGFVMAVTGVSPILVLGIGIVIDAAPPAKAGSASAIAEISNQLGVALGVALLGSIGAFVYRITLSKHQNFGLTGNAVNTVKENIIGAFSIATKLNSKYQKELILSAKEGFVNGLHVVALMGFIIFIVLAILIALSLGRASKNEDQKTSFK